MNKVIFIAVCILTFISKSVAQSQYIVEIDLQNGTYEKVGSSFPGVNFVVYEETTYDQNTGTFLFLTPPATKRLYSINTSNGQVQNNPQFSAVFFGIEFDRTTNTIYALQSTISGKRLVSISASTALETAIGNFFSPLGNYARDVYALNSMNQTYTLLAPPGILYTLSTLTGEVISSPTITLPSNTTLANMSYDNSTGNLFGLVRNNSNSETYLASIDYNSGVVTLMGQGINYGALSNSGTIDEVNQKYIFNYFSNQTYDIASLDLTSGALISNVNINPYSPNDNFEGIEYDNTQGKLYALHWDAQILGTENVETKEIALVPNPFSEYATLTIPDSKQGVFSIDIYNAAGMKVKRIENIATNEIRIEREHLSTGFYFFQLSSNNVPFHAGKFIVK